MADHTVPGIIGIVVIVLVVAIFLQGETNEEPVANYQTQPGANLAGGAFSTGQADGQACEPTRFCDGTKLVIIREDCSVANAFCQNGCLPDQKICA